MQSTSAIRSLRAATKSSSSSLVSSTSSTSSTSRHCPLSISSRPNQHHQQNRHHHHHHQSRYCQSLSLIRSNYSSNRQLSSKLTGSDCCAGNGYHSTSTSTSGSRRGIFTVSTSSTNQKATYYYVRYKQQSHPLLTFRYQQRRHVASSRRTTKRLRVQPAPSLVPGGLNGASAAIAGVQYSDHIVFNPPSSMPSVYHTPMKFLPKNDPRRKLYESHVQALAGSSSPPTSSSSLSSMTTSTFPPSSPSPDSSSSPPSWIPSQYIAKAGVPAASRTRNTTSTFSSLSSSSTPPPSDLNPSASPSVSSSDSSNGAASDNSTAAAATTTPSLPPMIRPIKPKKYHLNPADMDEMRRLRAEDPRTWTRAKLAEKFQCSNLFVGFVCRSPEMKRENEAKMAANRARWGRRKTEAKEDRRKRKEMWGRDV